MTHLAWEWAIRFALRFMRCAQLRALFFCTIKLSCPMPCSANPESIALSLCGNPISLWAKGRDKTKTLGYFHFLKPQGFEFFGILPQPPLPRHQFCGTCRHPEHKVLQSIWLWGLGFCRLRGIRLCRRSRSPGHRLLPESPLHRVHGAERSPVSGCRRQRGVPSLPHVDDHLLQGILSLPGISHPLLDNRQGVTHLEKGSRDIDLSPF